MGFFEDVVFPIAVILTIAGAAIAGIFGLSAIWERQSCANLHEVTGRVTQWRLFGGCYVQHEGEMLPYDRWVLLDVRVKERK